MQVQEAWATWASAVRDRANFTDHHLSLLERAVETLFQQGDVAELWKAVT